MEMPDRNERLESLDEAQEARLHRADFSGEAPGLLERLWAKIQARIAASDDFAGIPEDIDLSSEEMSLLTAARGNPFEGLGKFPKNGKKNWGGFDE